MREVQYSTLGTFMSDNLIPIWITPAWSSSKSSTDRKADVPKIKGNNWTTS